MAFGSSGLSPARLPTTRLDKLHNNSSIRLPLDSICANTLDSFCFSFRRLEWRNSLRFIESTSFCLRRQLINSSNLRAFESSSQGASAFGNRQQLAHHQLQSKQEFHLPSSGDSTVLSRGFRLQGTTHRMQEDSPVYSCFNLDWFNNSTRFHLLLDWVFSCAFESGCSIRPSVFSTSRQLFCSRRVCF